VINKFILTASMLAMAAMASSAGATINKPPHDEGCKRWELREVTKGFLLSRHKTEVWFCVSGENRGTTKSAKGTSKGSSVASGTPDSPSPSDTPSEGGAMGKGNNGKGTPNGGKTDGGDPPGGGNTGNDGQG
jgi:hypothetical protein